MRSGPSFWLCCVLFSIYSCISAQSPGKAYTDEQIPFSLEHSTKKIELPFVLSEISGLDYHEGRLLAVQDEAGVIFTINPQSGSIENQVKLFGPGDSEGVASDGKTLFLNTSEGLIFRINANHQTSAELLGTGLPEGGDYEALEWHQSAQKLLIATKDNLKGIDFPGKNRYIFAVEIKPPYAHQLFLTIDYEALKDYLQVDEKGIIQYADIRLEYDKPKPSGVAIDPLTGHIYVLNDSGKMLLVYQPGGKLKAIAMLDNQLFEKPEGIAFDPEGNLYISNEQKSQAANILFFQRQDGSGG